MNNNLSLALVVAVVAVSVTVLLVAHLRDKRAMRICPKATELTVTDATTWEVRMNGIVVAKLAEHAVAEIERHLNRQWWLGIQTAISEIGTFVELTAVSIASGLAMESILIALAIQGDPHGAGHVLRWVFSASEVTLQSGWTLFWQFGALFSGVYFALALMVGRRHRAHDFIAEAWWTNVRRAAGVAFDGSLSLVLTHENLQAWRSPRQIAVDRVRPH